MPLEKLEEDGAWERWKPKNLQKHRSIFRLVWLVFVLRQEETEQRKEVLLLK